MTTEVDRFIAGSPQWREEMRALRDILRDCGLDEAIKWGKPCYVADGSNIVIIQPFKEHLSLMFFKGALLDDPAGILQAQGENTRSAKRIEFTNVGQVADLAPWVTRYIEAAIAAEEAGLTVPRKAVEDKMPAELVERLRSDAEYRGAFEALTPGRRRSHILHIARAKKTETRQRRVEKCRAQVLSGKGFNER